MKKRLPLIIIYFSLLFIIASVLYFFRPQEDNLEVIAFAPTATPSPTPFIFTTYVQPKIEKKEVYKIVMVGDSMTAALGPHGGGMSEYMNTIYKEDGKDAQRIIIDNYAKSSNILSIDSQLTEKTTISEYTLEPLLSQDYSMILVESFGYNPLSQFGVEEGVKKQTEALDKLMARLITTRPKSLIVFVTTIAPNIQSYAKKTQPNNSEEERGKQAQERIAYLKNHISYATTHTIPLINIYEKSLTTNGDGNRKYINSTDDIHPSFVGVDFIGHEIGNYIHDNNLLPQ